MKGNNYQQLEKRIEQLESVVEQLRNPSSIEWMTPKEVEQQSKGKYRARWLINIIKRSSDLPGEYPFVHGIHYLFLEGEVRRHVRINYCEFDRSFLKWKQEK